jgi:hypothetical protein
MRLQVISLVGFAVALSGVGISACTSGIPDNCEGTFTCPPGTDGGADVTLPDGQQPGQDGSNGDGDADPIARCADSLSTKEAPCLIDEQYSVFVSPNGTDGPNAGTKAAPFKTLGAALTAAKAARKHVIACEGKYEEKVVLGAPLDGTYLHGGFDCGTWTYDASKEVEVAPDTTGYALEIRGLTTGAFLEDIAFASKDATADGASSIAAFAVRSQNVRFIRAKLTAGKGKAGVNGADRADFGAAAPVGNNASGLTAGAAAENTCGSVVSIGGAGGAGGAANNGNPGTPAISPVYPTGYTGAGGMGGGLCTLGTGLPGSFGAAGIAGIGAATAGTLTESGWAPANGTPGGTGGIGQGGGGGAGAPAGGGGSGGAGGCGGSGGGAGQGGGASIALLVFESDVSLQNSTLTADEAGRGGNGGRGQKGQQGGNASIGAGSGCGGAAGGFGGSGGGGGGGAGGVSAGIVWKGTAPTINGTATPSANSLTGVTLRGNAALGGTAGPGGEPTQNVDPVSRGGANGTAGRAGQGVAVLKID